MLKTRGTKIYCYDPGLRKWNTMGNVIGDAFFKKVKAVHFMRVVDGYGIQYGAFSEFHKEGIKRIFIIEQHTDTTWESRPEDWVAHGKAADYGRGKQLFLSLKYMKKTSRTQKELERQLKEDYRELLKQRAGLK